MNLVRTCALLTIIHTPIFRMYSHMANVCTHELSGSLRLEVSELQMCINQFSGWGKLVFFSDGNASLNHKRKKNCGFFSHPFCL